MFICFVSPRTSWYVTVELSNVAVGRLYLQTRQICGTVFLKHTLFWLNYWWTNSAFIPFVLCNSRRGCLKSRYFRSSVPVLPRPKNVLNLYTSCLVFVHFVHILKGHMSRPAPSQRPLCHGGKQTVAACGIFLGLSEKDLHAQKGHSWSCQGSVVRGSSGPRRRATDDLIEGEMGGWSSLHSYQQLLRAKMVAFLNWVMREFGVFQNMRR